MKLHETVLPPCRPLAPAEWKLKVILSGMVGRPVWEYQRIKNELHIYKKSFTYTVLYYQVLSNSKDVLHKTWWTTLFQNNSSQTIVSKPQLQTQLWLKPPLQCQNQTPCPIAVPLFFIVNLKTWSCGPPWLFWETMAKRAQVAEAKRRVKKVLEKTPFKPSPTIKQPRSMKDRQQMWVLSGLKHLRAPVVFWISNQYTFVSDLYVKVWFTIDFSQRNNWWHTCVCIRNSPSYWGLGDTCKHGLCDSWPVMGWADRSHRNICWMYGGDKAWVDGFMFALIHIL